MESTTTGLSDAAESSGSDVPRLSDSLVVRPVHSSQTASALAAFLGWPVSLEEAADIRHLIGIYYAERAADLVDEQWDKNGWTAATMHDWVREHLRTAPTRRAA